MKITNLGIKNFKAIKSASIELSSFNVIVGANGSGQSSILQALHWMFQSARNQNVKTNSANAKEGSTLSEKDATYLPSPQYQNSSHGESYGNFKGTLN